MSENTDLTATDLQFEIVSPEAILLSATAKMAVVPSAAGYFGVLPGHMPFVCTLGPGIVDIYENDATTVTKRVVVADGFAEVKDNKCVILADEAAELSEFNPEKYQAQLEELKEKFDTTEDPDDRDRVFASMKKVERLLEIVAENK